MPYWARMYAIPVILALALYFGAGFFIDLPPYGITLSSAATRIALDEGLAIVDSRLTYACRSWRPRQNSVYLPIPRRFGEGAAQGLRAQVPSLSSYQQFPDGVILKLVMLPHTKGSADFRFHQRLTRKCFGYAFSVERGWVTPPEQVTYQVAAPAAWHCSFSLHPIKVETTDGGLRKLYTLPDSKGRELKIEWD